MTDTPAAHPRRRPPTSRRRVGLAALTTTLTLLAGAAAISLNTGILGASGNDDVGTVSPVATSASGSATQGNGFGDAATPAGSADERLANPSRDGQSHDDGYEHEYEGADDDD